MPHPAASRHRPPPRPPQPPPPPRSAPATHSPAGPLHRAQLRDRAPAPGPRPPRTLDRASPAGGTAPGRHPSIPPFLHPSLHPFRRRRAAGSLPSSFIYSSKPSLETRHHLPKNASMAMAAAALRLGLAVSPGKRGGRRTAAAGAATAFIAGPATCAAGESQWGARRAPAPSPPSPRPASPARGGGGKSGHAAPLPALLPHTHSHTHTPPPVCTPEPARCAQEMVGHCRSHPAKGCHSLKCFLGHKHQPAPTAAKKSSTLCSGTHGAQNQSLGFWFQGIFLKSGALDPKLYHLLHIMLLILIQE